MDKATLLEMEMNDGTSVQLTLTYGRLYRLRQKAKDVYETYNKIAMDGMEDELQCVDYLYAAYLCANIDDLDSCMSIEEFMGKMPLNHMQVFILVNKLKLGEFKKK